MNNSDRKNFYEILELTEDASPDDIKKSYRRLSLLHHPDKNGNSPESKSKFQEICEAYEILGNPENKMRYDGEKNGINIMTNDIHELFRNLFQMSANDEGTFRIFHANIPHQIRPPSIVQSIVIPFEKVLMDLKIPVEITRFIHDENMKITETETIYVYIPIGIDDGEIMIIREKGNIINNFKGDVKIFIKIENSTEFKRFGLDLIYEKTISLKDALCGFRFELKHLNSKTYTITNSNAVGNVIHPNYKKMIPNMGLSRDNHIGNLIIIFSVKFPEVLSETVLEELKNIDF